MTDGFNEEAFMNYHNSDGQTVRKGKDRLYHIHPNYYEDYVKQKSLYEMFTPSSKQEYEGNKGLYDKARKEGVLGASGVTPTDQAPDIQPMEEPFPAITLAQEGPMNRPETAQFSPYSEYVRQREEGKNDFGRAYVEATYSGLGLMSRNSLLLGASLYDKTAESNLPAKAKTFVNLLRPYSKPVFEWEEIFRDLESNTESNVTQEVWDWYEENIFSQVEETEGFGPTLMEGVAQYTIPYFGARNLMGSVLGNPAVSGVIDKVVKEGTKRKVLDEAIVGSVGIAGATFGAAGPEDENAIGFLMELFNLPEGEAGTMYNRMYQYFTTEVDLSEGVDADVVLRQKTKAFFGDLGLDPVMSGTLMLIAKSFDSISKIDFKTLKAINDANKKYTSRFSVEGK